nr:unnamed protein product [Digitaria exilis]
MVAIALLGPCVPGGDNDDTFTAEKSVGWWTIYAVLLLAVLMVTIIRMEFPGIIKLADYALGDKQECCRRLVLSLCMIGAIGVVSFSFSLDLYDRIVMISAEVCTILFVSFGNFQIPGAIVRVVLPLIRLIQHNYNTPCKENAASSTASAPAPSDDNAKANLAPSLGIFYGMVLGQGALYLVACGLEVFSFIPRRCLVRRAGFRGQWGVDSVKMYYKYAMQKCMERNVLASNVLAPEISLCNFAIDSLNSDSTKRQLHGIRIVHILLQRDPATRTRLLVKLTAETMTRLLRMLDWTGQGHETIRLVAVKVIDELARDLLIVTVPGRVQNVSLLLVCADGPSSTDGDRFLRKVAGQALAMLAMGNVDNCRAMLREDTGYSIVKELRSMIQVARYRCVAASLLRSVCMLARPELKEEDLEALSRSSQEVLERILREEGAELEIFIGLSSNIYKAIPEEFTRDLEYSQIKETFVKRLVDALNANMEPDADCPGIRRVILEQAINLMECDSRNVKCFHDHRMMEALSMVESTMSEAENYSIFLGDVGLMEAGEPLSSLVARAKQLLAAVR